MTRFSLPTGIILNVSVDSWGATEEKKGVCFLVPVSPIGRPLRDKRVPSSQLLKCGQLFQCQAHAGPSGQQCPMASSSPSIFLGRFCGGVPLRRLPVNSFPWHPRGKISSKFHQRWHPSDFCAVSKNFWISPQGGPGRGYSLGAVSPAEVVTSYICYSCIL